MFSMLHNLSLMTRLPSTGKLPARRAIYLTLVGLALFAAMPAGFGQTTGQSPASDAKIGFTEQDIAQAIAENRELLRKYPHQDFTPLVMFQLCELYVRRATLAYQKEMAIYEAALKRFDAGELQAEPVAPRIDFREAVELGDQILVKYPTANFIDKVLYRLALCHLEEGNHEMSRAYLERLIAEYPKSAYLLEGYFRLGENYFDKRQYDRAIAAYSKLFDQWDNPYFDMALYKLGWAYYNLNDYAKAISTFIYLIDDINRVSTVADASPLGKTKVDLRKEAVEYIAECFAEMGGAQKAEKFFTESLQPFETGAGERDYLIDVFLKLAETYRSRNDYDGSAAALETVLRRWPMYLEAPKLQNKIVESHLQNGDSTKAEAAREALVRNYGPGSVWLNHYFGMTPSPGIIEARLAALTLADAALYTLATEAQARGQKNELESDFKLAISRYHEYLEKFPNSPAAPKVQYFQAECYYEIKAFAEAAGAYQKVVINYPASEFAGEADYNRVLAHLEEINQAGATDSVICQINAFLGSAETQILRVPGPAYAKLLTACNDFSVSPAAREKLPEVLMKYGETLYKLGQFELSRRIYVKVATDLAPNEFVLQANTMVGQTNFLLHNYAEAETWYRKIVTDFPDSTRQVERAQKIIATSRFKIAEDMKTQGNVIAAAQAFANLADSSHDAEIAEHALVEAATLYENNGNQASAMGVYEQLYAKFPESERAQLALLKAAQLAEEQSNWQRAVQNYLRLANDFPVSEHAPKAVFQAGRCYENARDTLNAIATFRRYAQTYKEEPSQLLEVLVKIGELYQGQDEVNLAEMSFQETITNYNDFLQESKPVDEYFPAQAQFLIAEIRFQEYRQIDLVPPVDRNFQKKQKLFNEVMALYRAAAEYQVADWTTAASYKIGATFEEFARAFSEAPRPDGLSETDLGRYEEALKQKVRPFKERALETYRATISLAEENNVSNEWVENSRQRAEALAAELGVASNGEATPPPSDGAAESTN